MSLARRMSGWHTLCHRLVTVAGRNLLPSQPSPPSHCHVVRRHSAFAAAQQSFIALAHLNHLQQPPIRFAHHALAELLRRLITEAESHTAIDPNDNNANGRDFDEDDDEADDGDAAGHQATSQGQATGQGKAVRAAIAGQAAADDAVFHNNPFAPQTKQAATPRSATSNTSASANNGQVQAPIPTPATPSPAAASPAPSSPSSPANSSRGAVPESPIVPGADDDVFPAEPALSPGMGQAFFPAEVDEEEDEEEEFA
jgi:hypothetical protein